MFSFLNYGINNKKIKYLLLSYGTNDKKLMQSFLNYETNKEKLMRLFLNDFLTLITATSPNVGELVGCHQLLPQLCMGVLQ